MNKVHCEGNDMSESGMTEILYLLRSSSLTLIDSGNAKGRGMVMRRAYCLQMKITQSLNFGWDLR